MDEIWINTIYGCVLCLVHYILYFLQRKASLFDEGQGFGKLTILRAKTDEKRGFQRFFCPELRENKE